jgi:hypothetical protein
VGIRTIKARVARVRHIEKDLPESMSRPSRPLLPDIQPDFTSAAAFPRKKTGTPSSYFQ